MSEKKNKLKFDIAAPHETRIPDHDFMKEKDFKTFWHDKSVDVRFSVKNTILQSVEVGSDGNKRIITLRLHTKRKEHPLSSTYMLIRYMLMIKSRMHSMRD